MTRTYVKMLAAIAAFLTLTASIAPAHTIIDLRNPGESANPNAAFAAGGFDDFIVQQTTDQPTQEGVIHPFVRLRAKGNEQGYNTDFRDAAGQTQFDEKESLKVTHSLKLSDVPIVTIDGTDYRQFLLDINQKDRGNKSFLSLNQVQIFLRNAPDLNAATIVSNPTITTIPPVIDFLDGTSNEVFRLSVNNNLVPTIFEIKLDASLNSRGQQGDMFLYVRDAAFHSAFNDTDPTQPQAPPLDYVYLYSQFGNPPGAYASNGRFEEWAVLKNAPNPVPEPPTVALVLTGLGTLGLAGLRRRHRSE